MLSNVQNRFLRDPDFQGLYEAVLGEYLKLGHMEPVKSPSGENTFYVPDHGVLRAFSTTTKLRLVFNGTQKAASGMSLNECLHAGPNVQTDLVDVIRRWRCQQFVLTADIEKMYRQVLVFPEDHDYQRILWSGDLQQPATAYRLCTVTYGLACAPFLAIRVLRQLAVDEGPKFPLATDVIKDNFYVDDGLSGADTIETAREKATQVDQLPLAGGFHLQKWESNCEGVLSNIEKSRCQNISKSFKEDPTLRALGIIWNPVTDSFVLTANQDKMTSPVTLTKRSILSMVAKLFDPLEWLAPVVIVAKIFLQSLRKTPLNWDDRLPDDLEAKWAAFSQNLKTSIAFSIPRWIRKTPSSEVEFHGFSDASNDALAAVVYQRVLKYNLEASTCLLMAKIKVAPLKFVSIARLELSAAVLLAKLVLRCQESLRLTDAPIHLWTDSSVELTWISGHPSRWKDFVRNRVSIQEKVPKACWHHVPGDQNPADVASRGTSPQHLLHHPLWWNGPKWLSFPSPAWPSKLPNLPVDANLEERPSAVHFTTTEPTWDLVDRYSTWIYCCE